MDGLLSDADVGLTPDAPAAPASPPVFAPPPVNAGDTSEDSAPPLTVTRAPPSSATPNPPSVLSDADVGITSPVSTTSDVAQSAASGLESGTTGVAGLPGDVQQMSNSIWDRLALGAAHKIMDWTGHGNEKADFDKAWAAASPGGVSDQALTSSGAPTMDTLPTTADLNTVLTKVGANPNYQPQTTLGRYTKSVAEFAPAALVGPGSAVEKLGIGTIAPGVGSEALGNMFEGSPLQPYARMAGALAGGVGAAGGLEAAQRASTFAAPVVAKGLAAVGRPAMQERLAGQQLISNASDPAAFRQALADTGSDELVPGSQPTTYQLTGDQGIGQLERGDRTNNPAPYQVRAEQQNAARLSALSDGTQGNPEAVSSHLTDQLSQLDAAAQGHVDQARAAAQDAANGIGTGAGPEVVGADLRQHLAAANDVAKTNERALWQAVDPDGTLVNPTDALTAANNKIYGSLSPTAQNFVSPAEKTFSGIVSGYNPTEPFQQIADLRSNLAAAMRQERMTNGNSPAYARMSQLMGAVQDTINNAVEGKVAQEARAVSEGALAPEDTMEARIRQAWNVPDVAANAVGDARGYRPSNLGAPLRASPQAFGRSGTNVPSGGGFRQAQSGSGISETALQRQPKGQVADTDVGHAALMNAVRADTLDQYLARFPEYTSNENVLGLRHVIDDASDKNSLSRTYNIDDMAGRDHGVVNTEYDPVARSIRIHSMEVRNLDRGLSREHATGLIDDLKRDYPDAETLTGLRITGARGEARPDVTMRLKPAKPPLLSDARASAPAAAERADTPSGVSSPAPDAAARLKAASKATADRKQTFAKGQVGQVLAPGQMAGQYRLPSSGVPAKLFPSGPSGYEAVKAYHAAAGTGQDAVEALQNAAMEKLRQRMAASTDGLLTPQALASWKTQHANALRAMDEVSPGFSSRFDNAAQATERVEQMAARKASLIKAYQTGVLGKVMNAGSADEVTNRVGQLLGTQADRVSQMQRLVRATANNSDAQAGLRRAVADAMARKFMSQTEAGTSRQKAISANAYKKLVDQGAPVLSQVFTPAEMDNFRAVAADLDRSNRSVVGSKVAGSPGTAQDLKQAEKSGHHGPATSLLDAAWKGGMTGAELHGPHGALLGAGSGAAAYLATTLRRAGIHDVQSMVSDALLNPDRARQYIRRVPNEPAARHAGAVLKRSFLAYPALGQTNASRQ